MTVKVSRTGARPRGRGPDPGGRAVGRSDRMAGEPGGRRLTVATPYESDKTPVRTMPAARRDTLAPWLLRVGTATGRRASSRMRGCPGDRRGTSRRARAGRGTPAPLIPVLTSVPPATGTWPAAPPRRPGAVPGRTRPRRPVAAPDRPQPGRPVAGQPRVGQPVAGRPEPAQGPPRPCLRVAGHPGAAQGRLRPCPLVAGQPRVGQPAPGRPEAAQGHSRPARPGTAPGRPRPRRRAACPTPATAAPPGRPDRVAARPGAGARSGVTRRCRASRARSTRPASSPGGTGRPSAPPGWA